MVREKPGTTRVEQFAIVRMDQAAKYLVRSGGIGIQAKNFVELMRPDVVPGQKIGFPGAHASQIQDFAEPRFQAWHERLRIGIRSLRGDTADGEAAVAGPGSRKTRSLPVANHARRAGEFSSDLEVEAGAAGFGNALQDLVEG